MEVPTAADGYPRNGVVPDDWSADSGPYDLMSAAARLGALAWTERELHRVVGGWVRDAADPRGVVLFDRLAIGHARRAEMLVARLPELRELPVDTVLIAPGDATLAAVERLAGPADDAGRAAAWTVVGRALAASYDQLLRRSTPVADAPLRRRIPPLLDDLGAELGATVGCFGDGADGAPDGIETLVSATRSFTV